MPKAAQPKPCDDRHRRRTIDGRAAVSDAFFHYRNVEEDHPIGICENINEALAAHRRAREADHIVPLYDPEVFERCPETGSLGGAALSPGAVRPAWNLTIFLRASFPARGPDREGG